MGIFDFLGSKARPAATDHDNPSCPCVSHQQAGNERLCAGDHAAALKCFDSAVQVCSTNYRAWGNRGVCLRNLNRPDEAMKSFDRALALEPNYGHAWENKGVLLASLGREDEALSAYKTAWKRDPTRAMPRVRAARIYIDRKQYGDAITQCREALRVEPGSWPALSKLALALQESGEGADARKAYEEAIRANPSDADTLNNYGTLLEELNQPKQAIECYEKALAADPRYETARLNLERLRKRVASAASPTPAKAASSGVLPVSAELKAMLLAAARDGHVIPGTNLVEAEPYASRGRTLAAGLLAALANAPEETLAKPVEALFRLYCHAFLVGLDDAYGAVRGGGAASLSQLSTKDALVSEPRCPSVPREMFKLEGGNIAYGDMMLATETWWQKNRARVEAAGVNRGSVLSYSLYWTYIVGVNRGFVLLGTIPRGDASITVPAVDTPAKPPPSLEASEPTGSPKALIEAAKGLGLLSGNSLGMVPEVTHMFEEAAQMLHALAVESMTKAAADGDPESGLAVMQRSCMYLFGKGVQAVMVWSASPGGKFGMNFEPGDMARMTLDSCSEISETANRLATDSMKYGIPLFGAHRSFMEAAIEARPSVDEGYVRAEMLETLRWIPRIAISYALEKRLHASNAR